MPEDADPVESRRTSPPSEQRQPPKRFGRGSLWPWLLMLLVFLWYTGTMSADAGRIPYSQFKQHLARGDVVELELGEQEIQGALKPGAKAALAAAAAEDEAAAGDSSGAQPGELPEIVTGDEDGEPARNEPFRSWRVEDRELVKQLEAAGVSYSGVERSTLGPLLLAWLLPIGLLVMIFLFFRSAAKRAAGGQMMGFGKSRARLVAEEGTGVTFADVAGASEAKQELSQMVEFLRDPTRFTGLGGRIPKGVLLLGPPGTGKTLLARAVAGEAGVPFFSLTGSDFVEMFVGVGAARVRDLFEKAKTKAPCIVFIDEVDAIGRQRGVSMGVVNDEREQTLNQLLSEMDGFEANSGVILLAATNRPEILDKALLRPGRFDRQVVLDAPDRSGREAILRVHVRGKPMADDVDLARIAQATPGMSGADLANAVNEAALLAADARHEKITQRDLEEAVEKVVTGPERRSRRLEADEKRRVACHESGHALVATRTEKGVPVQKITIVPRGRAALGYTMQLPEQEHFLRTRQELLDRLAVALAGRAAERLVLGDVSTGAQDDLRVATDIARQMVCLFGMSERLGPAHCARPSEGAFLSGDGGMVRDCSEQTSREIDEEVRGLLEAASERATRILESERDVLERLAAALLEQESLDREGFERIVGVDGGNNDDGGNDDGGNDGGDARQT